MPLYTYDDGATYNEGDTFNGDLLNGFRHGQGTYTWANGDTYVGPFIQRGYMNGEGIKTYANGDVYKGSIEYGYETGVGTKTFANGDIFTFDMNGEVIKTYANGDVYTGGSVSPNNISGDPIGEGTKTWANGDVYSGSFAAGWARTDLKTPSTYVRQFGTTKFGADRFFKGFLDGFAKSSGGVVEGKIPYFLDTATVDKLKTGINTTDAVLQDNPKAWVSNKTYDNGSSTTITYSFSGTSDLYLFNEDYFDPNPKIDTVSAFSVSQQEAARLALKQFSDVADITFVEVEETAAEVGTIRIGFVSSQYENTWGWASSPGNDRFGDYSPKGGDVWVEDSNKDGPFIRGRDPNFGSLMHEIGHALGLAHPHAGEENLPSHQDFTNYTIMSYESREDSYFIDSAGIFNDLISSTPMVYDIAAIQHLYGAASHNESDTVYKFDPSKPFAEAIWDSGGYDTLDLSNFIKACTINLTPGDYSTIVCTDWSMADNLGIAFGTTIEEVIGGSSNDIITGNSADNVLYGSAGNDTLVGGSGADALIGGAGDDTLDGGDNEDALDYTGSTSKVSLDSALGTATDGLGGTDTFQNVEAFYGSSYDDELLGKATDETVLIELNALNGDVRNYEQFRGNEGADTIDGRGGYDELSYGNATSGLTIDLAKTSQPDGLGSVDTIANIEGVEATKYDDIIYGTDGDNSLDGHFGNNTIDGRGGFDFVEYNGSGRHNLNLNLSTGVATFTKGHSRNFLHRYFK